MPKDCAKSFQGMNAIVASHSPAAHPYLHHHLKRKGGTSAANVLLVLATMRNAAAPPAMRLSTVSYREPRAP